MKTSSKLPPDFKHLPEMFSQGTRHFKLLKREGMVCLFAIRLGAAPDWSLPDKTWEVVVLRRVLKGRTIKGETYMPPRDEMPSDSHWGSRGFSPPTLARAEEIFSALVAEKALTSSLPKAA